MGQVSAPLRGFLLRQLPDRLTPSCARQAFINILSFPGASVKSQHWLYRPGLVHM